MKAVDIETTGLDIWHGCLPFMVGMCSDEGEIKVYEWDVDPMTRIPNIPQRDKQRLRKDLNEDELLYHNAKFDTLGLDRIDVINVDKSYWDRVHDTHLASHVTYSAGPHGLKFLGEKLLGIDDSDQKELQNAVNEARRIGRSLGWRIAKPRDPHFPSIKKFGKNEVHRLSSLKCPDKVSIS